MLWHATKKSVTSKDAESIPSIIAYFTFGELHFEHFKGALLITLGREQNGYHPRSTNRMVPGYVSSSDRRIVDTP